MKTKSKSSRGEQINHKTDQCNTALAQEFQNSRILSASIFLKSTYYGWGFRGPSHGCLYSWRDGVTDLTVDAHLLWLWVPLWLGSQSHGHHLLLLGSLGLCYHLLWPGCKGYDGIVGTVSAVPQFCLLYGFQFTLFKMKRWVKFSDMLVCLAEAPCWPVAVLLVINWRGKIQGAFHSAMMLMWFPFLNSYYQFSFHHIHQRVFPR